MVLAVSFLLNPESRTRVFHSSSVLHDLDAAFNDLLSLSQQKFPDTQSDYSITGKQEMKATKAYAGQKVPDKGLRGFLFR